MRKDQSSIRSSKTKSGFQNVGYGSVNCVKGQRELASFVDLSDVPHGWNALFLETKSTNDRLHDSRSGKRMSMDGFGSAHSWDI